MYICVCNAVTENHIEQAVQQGARRMRDLRTQLGVTAECSRCAHCAHQCLQSVLADNKVKAWSRISANTPHRLPTDIMQNMEAA